MKKIFKFGGASVKNSDAIMNLKKIVSKQKENLTAIVVSAIDKTTNNLEEVWKNYQNGDVISAIQKTNKCIFLDRDGVLNRTKLVNGKSYAPLVFSEFIFLPNVIKSINILKKKIFW